MILTIGHGLDIAVQIVEHQVDVFRPHDQNEVMLSGGESRPQTTTRLVTANRALEVHAAW